MLRIEDPKFKESIKQIEEMNSATRLKFFKQGGPDVFMMFWFFYYREDFITKLAYFHYEWIESLFEDKNVMIE